MLDHGFLSEDICEIKAENSYIMAYAKLMELSEEHSTFLINFMEHITESKLLNPNAKSSTRALCVLNVYLIAIKHPMKADEYRDTFKCNYGTVLTISLDLFLIHEELTPLVEENNFPHEGLNTFSEKSKRVVKKRRAKTGRIALGPPVTDSK
ncbi:hypothetical protein GN244_ATG16818 [Phytophthora infestans]|uniref:Uncharacterized protein n=1 Tax=Phytophthora infestans TaxID=4787 RepID=A0A833SKR8_PHYIN|nr:hypothetical protein GN244_ATG16818 [Phytophthora infestans]KAF4141790.1 hypothetical protein GN958_ATG09035 [Phytophthora infestans]